MSPAGKYGLCVGDTEPSLPASRIAHQVWLCAAAVVLVVPNVAAVIVPFENWPWTNAPMFAASPVDNALSSTSFTLELADGGSRPLPTRAAAGLNQWHFRRSFLTTAWGSDDASTPFGHVANDTDELRAARVGHYFDALVRYAKKKRRGVFDGVVAVRVEVQQVQPTTTPMRTLGRYVLKDRRFILAETP